MPIIVENVRQVVPAGVIQGVLAEVFDRGEVETKWGPKHKIRFVYEVTEKRAGSDVPLTVAIDFNATWTPKGDLWKHVQASLGRPFTSEESRRLNLDNLVGMNNLLTIQHNESGDRTYANIVGIMPLMGNMEVISVSPHYIPQAELIRMREEKALAAGATTGQYVV